MWLNIRKQYYHAHLTNDQCEKYCLNGASKFIENHSPMVLKVVHLKYAFEVEVWTNGETQSCPPWIRIWRWSLNEWGHKLNQANDQGN